MNENLSFENNLKNTLWLYLFCFGAMWLIYLLNNVVTNGALTLGISPRRLEFTEFISIFTSWMFHGNKPHIIGNSLALVMILWALPVFEKRPFYIFWLLVFFSGCFTWLLAFSGTIHIGASGLIYALFGYIITQAIYAKKFTYMLLSAVLIFYFYASFFSGLIPQKNISLAGHFGGFIAGIFTAFILHEKPKPSYFESRTKTRKYSFFNFFQKK